MVARARRRFCVANSHGRRPARLLQARAMSNDSRPRWGWLWLAAALYIGLAATPAPLAAQIEADQSGGATEIQQFEDWTLRCQPASETQPRTCRINQKMVVEDGGMQVLQFLAGRFGPEKVLGAVIFVPIGVRLPPGLGIQVDEQPLRVFPFEVCSLKSCQAHAILEGDFIKDLKAGLTGQVMFQNAVGQVLIVPLSLKGFSAALRALP